MELGLRGLKVLVTGASAGIGAGIARSMAAEGARLVLVARTLAKLEEIRTSILRDHPDLQIELEACNLSDSKAIDDLAQRHSDVDVLVNNAGAVPTGNLFDVDEAAWRAGWDTKVFPYINMCRRFYLVQKARGGGVIINVLGSGSLQKKFSYLCGGMGNAALDFFTETLGAHSPIDNIRVLGVCPGPVATERYRAITELRVAQGIAQPKMPFNRIATPQELGDMVTFLASSRCGYVSGSIHVVDAGISVAKAV